MKLSVNQQNAWVWQTSELTAITCPICNSENFKAIYSRADSLDIVSCQSCSFRFVQPQPSQRELNRFYQEGYFSGDHDFHQGKDYFNSRKRAIAREEVTGWRFLKSHADLSQKRLLDLGCADGALLVLARQYGASQVVGVEVSADAAGYGRKQYGLEILEASADSLPLADQSFDIVTAFDLIEHVRHPAQLFREVHRVLSIGGVFVGGCPDMSCFDDWGGEWSGVCRNMEHLSYFDDRTLSKIAEQFGFKVTLIEYQGFPLEFKQYHRLSPFKTFPILQKALQPNVWVYNLLQKTRVNFNKSQHRHELLFVLERL
jgi:SAM-dependent methyltransferase/ribosomal protein S27E